MQLTTFGGLRLQGTDFTRPKPLLLLCYLAIEGPQQRRVLADVFFPDTKEPRDSLSTAYRHLAQVGEQVVEADGRRLSSRVACDAVQLIDELDMGVLEPALVRYRGPFLDGIDLTLSTELEEWVFGMREYLASRVRTAHLRVGELLAGEGKSTMAAQHAEAALGLTEAPPLDPEDFPRIYFLLDAGASPRAAEVRAEAEEFGIDIARAPREAPHATSRVGDAGLAPPNNLPVQSTSFVGRDRERLEIAELLVATHGRTLTLHGPGGIGKSRLALRVARDQVREGRFVDGVFLVDLEAVGASENIPEAIASATGASLGGPGEPVDQLVDQMHRGHRLLVLDGFEHLIDGAWIVARLTRACPDLKVLVTSRMALNLEGEHVIGLRGLPGPRTGVGFEEALVADALQLLVQRAKKARLDFELTPGDLREAAELCRLVDGSPLAIELAMTWIRALPLAEIRQSIERDLGFLASPARNAQERHQSLRAVFEGSWELLGSTERVVLRNLAIFSDGFRRQAAAEVAGASLPILMRLVDASLLQVDAHGRYRLHSLIHQFCRERLQEDARAWDEVAEQHQEYYRAHAAQLASMLYTSEEGDALLALDADLANVVTAWDRIWERDADPARDFPSQLVVFFDRMGRYREGIRFFRAAHRAVEAHAVGEASLNASIEANLAWLYFRTGDLAQAERLARLATSQSSFRGAGAMSAHNTLGLVLKNSGREEEAASEFASAIEIAGARDEPNRAAMYLLNLATTKDDLGNRQGAMQDLHEIIRIATEREYPFLLAMAKNNLGIVLSEYEDYRGARSMLEASLDLAISIGYDVLVPAILANLAEIHVEGGAVPEAKRLIDQARAAIVDARDGALQALVWDVAGRIELEEGRPREAEASFRRSLDYALQHPNDHRYLKVLVHIGESWLAEGDALGAYRLAHEIRAREKLPSSVRVLLDELLESIPESVAKGGKRTLDEGADGGVLERILLGRKPM